MNSSKSKKASNIFFKFIFAVIALVTYAISAFLFISAIVNAIHAKGIVSTDIASWVVNSLNLAVLLFYLPMSTMYLVYILLGVIPSKKYHVSIIHKCSYAHLVCARNEGVVIKSLLNSFNELDYPSQLQTIFICVNNSTDDTLSIIQEYIKISKVKIYIIEKPFKQNNNKGKTIDFLLNYINQHYLNKFDRYAFWDADNVIDKKWLNHVGAFFDNNAIDCLSTCRFPTNTDNIWGYLRGFVFIMESEFENVNKQNANIDVNFTGCGFVVNQKILEGLNWKWNFHKLVEDVEISMHLQSHGVRMGYCQNAIFYDQQPTTWSAFYTQGHRWAKGSLQLFFDKTSRNNIFHLNNTINRTDWFYRSFPNTIIFIFSIVLNIITSILTQPLFNICILQSIWQIDLATSSIILFTTLVMVALSIISIYRFCKHKKSAWYKNIYYVLLGPVSLMITIILTIPAYFAKPQWKPIPRAHPTKV